jgi:hypothetical protein
MDQHRMQVYLPKDLFETLRRLAFDRRQSIGSIIRELIIKGLEEQKGKKK